MIAYGVFNLAIRDRHTKNARTVIGVDKSGIVLLMVVCETTINLDDGGSSAMAIQGQIVNQPNDDGVFGERAVVNHLAVYRL